MLCVCMPGMAAETDRKDELFRFRPPPSSESRPIIIFLLSLLSGWGTERNEPVTATMMMMLVMVLVGGYSGLHSGKCKNSPIFNVKKVAYSVILLPSDKF